MKERVEVFILGKANYVKNITKCWLAEFSKVVRARTNGPILSLLSRCIAASEILKVDKQFVFGDKKLGYSF